VGAFTEFEGVRFLIAKGGVGVEEGVNRTCVLEDVPPLSRIDCGGEVGELVGIVVL